MRKDVVALEYGNADRSRWPTLAGVLKLLVKDSKTFKSIVVV